MFIKWGGVGMLQTGSQNLSKNKRAVGWEDVTKIQL